MKNSFNKKIHYFIFLILNILLFYSLVKIKEISFGSYNLKYYIHLIVFVSSIAIVYLVALQIKKSDFLRNKTSPLVNIFYLPLVLFILITDFRININIFKILSIIIWIISTFIYINNYNNIFDLDYKKSLIYPDNLILVEVIYLLAYYFALVFFLIGFASIALIFTIFIIYFSIYLANKSYKTRLDDSKVFPIFAILSFYLIRFFKYLPRPLLSFNICFILACLVYYYCCYHKKNKNDNFTEV